MEWREEPRGFQVPGRCIGLIQACTHVRNERHPLASTAAPDGFAKVSGFAMSCRGRWVGILMITPEPWSSGCGGSLILARCNGDQCFKASHIGGIISLITKRNRAWWVDCRMGRGTRLSRVSSTDR